MKTIIKMNVNYNYYDYNRSVNTCNGHIYQGILYIYNIYTYHIYIYIGYQY